MPSKKMHTKKSASKHTSSTAKASANSSHMGTSHSVEYCVGCRGKVKTRTDTKSTRRKSKIRRTITSTITRK